MCWKREEKNERPLVHNWYVIIRSKYHAKLVNKKPRFYHAIRCFFSSLIVIVWLRAAYNIIESNNASFENAVLHTRTHAHAKCSPGKRKLISLRSSRMRKIENYSRSASLWLSVVLIAGLSLLGPPMFLHGRCHSLAYSRTFFFFLFLFFLVVPI